MKAVPADDSCPGQKNYDFHVHVDRILIGPHLFFICPRFAHYHDHTHVDW